MSDYHLFMNVVTGKNGKSVKKWYYWYYDQSGKQVKRVCQNCKNKAEAEAYINSLPPLQYQLLTVSDIAKTMFLPGSDHWNRRKQFGKSIKEITMIEARHYVELILETFGDENIQALTVPKIQDYLFKVERSGSWNNRYLDIFSEVYDEAVWKGVKVVKPAFIKFKRDSTPSSILSTDEINRLFVPDNFTSEMFYLFFLVSLSAGLRLGEARALRVSQFRDDFQALIVDGFMTKDGIRNPYNKKGSEEQPRFRVVLLPAMTAEIVFSYVQKLNLGYNESYL
ncbi:MAG: hypothetical protein LBU99_07615 [Spirochaetaceae bacterium]|nr:hypothetical protein [Spirochaetaceae bacterium]